MKSCFQMLTIMLSVFLLLPTLAFAEDGENPIKKIRGFLKFNWSWLDGLEWLFSPVNLILSIVLVIGFLALIGRIIWKIVKIKKGQSIFKDKEFWIETGLITVLIFMLFSGSLFKIMENIYDWTNKQDIGGQPTSHIETQIKDNDVRNA